MRNEVGDREALSDQIKKEKDALLSMFLANATITELAAQYKLIDELNARVFAGNSGRD